MTEQEKKRNLTSIEDEWYTYKDIGGIKYKYLKHIPYRFGIGLTKLMGNYVQKDGSYDLSNWDIEKIMEIVLCNMVVEPKIDTAFLYSDKCPLSVFILGNDLTRKVLESDDIKDITGISFGDEKDEISEEDEELLNIDKIINDTEL